MEEMVGRYGVLHQERENQKQVYIGVLLKRYFEIMKQIYRRTPMAKCDFNKVAKHFY